MVIDIELTLNRFGFGEIAENKFQFFCLRFSKWYIAGKHSISFEINWRTKETGESMLIEKQAREKAQNKQKILDFIVGKDRITNDDVQSFLGVSDATAERYLDELEKQGVLAQKGEKKGVYYQKIS